METETILEKTKKKLPKKEWVNKIQQQLEENGWKVYAEYTIKLVMNGKRENENILMAAIQVAAKHQEELEKLTKSIQ